MVHISRNPPESIQHHLRVRLAEHAKGRWPALVPVEVRFRPGFAYIDGVLPNGQVLELCRLRFHGALHAWNFAICLASQDGCEDDFLPSGLPSGSPEGALDCACGLYLNDPSAWATRPTNYAGPH